MPAESMDFLQDGQRLWLYLRREILSAIALGQACKRKRKKLSQSRVEDFCRHSHGRKYVLDSRTPH